MLNSFIDNNKIIIQFNEANFDLIKFYSKENKLPFFNKLLNEYSEIETYSENEYENLEPWIQWYSFYTRLDYKNHKIFNLGDSLKADHAIFLDDYSDKKVAAFASMNLPPRDYFYKYFPDPWTESVPINLSFKENYINYALKQLINDNAEYKFDLKSVIGLLFLFDIPKNLNDLKIYKRIFFGICTKNRALLASSFDYLLAKYCMSQIKKNDIDISMFFLNGLAHIQHHYLYFSTYYKDSDENNSNLFKGSKKYNNLSKDPIFQAIEVYDLCFQNLENKFPNSEIWVITGLSQEKYKNPSYYWRFKNHQNILKEANISFSTIEPRMTRDFQISFDSEEDLLTCQDFLMHSKINNSIAFGNIQRLGRLHLFCSFIYDEGLAAAQLVSRLGCRWPRSHAQCAVASWVACSPGVSRASPSSSR